MKNKSIGVIGAGIMGVGVAQSLAQSGLEVTLVDLTDQILNNAFEQLEQNLRFTSMFTKKQKINIPEVTDKISLTADYEKLRNCDYIIENIPEKVELKKRLFQKIDNICKPESIFITNTSCISITKIAGFTKRPDKVIGIHFMNPVHLKNTVEVIKGYHTSEETVEFTTEFLEQINKEAIIVKDMPGFVSNRISHLFMNEAAFVVQDGIATAQQVDAIFKRCYEHKMGPLETADLIGIDTVVSSLDVLYDSYQDTKYRCCPLLKKMVDAGFLGKKSGQGFYKYSKF